MGWPCFAGRAKEWQPCWQSACPMCLGKERPCFPWTCVQKGHQSEQADLLRGEAGGGSLGPRGLKRKNMFA